jgi:hypothetical protein
VKASQIVADAILYWDPSTKWAEGNDHGTMSKVKVVDPTPRHWKWDFNKHRHVDNGRPTLMGTYGIMVEVQEDPYSYPTFDKPKVKIATLNSLRGPYEQVAPRVAEAREARASAYRTAAAENKAANERIASVAANGALLGVKATGIYPFTMVQLPIAEFESMVAALAADGWRYEVP